MASPTQQPLRHPSPVPDTQPSPEPDPLSTSQPNLTVMATATIADQNPNLDASTPEPPMAVPLIVTAQPHPSSNSTSRRLPPPCWTPDETASLIDAYREKWYALRRGNLRAAHWQDVADEVHSHCPDVSPPKTAVQCRHKMEKLRKRYRAELQRAKSIPHHRFSSSWVYFSKMETMEKSGSPTSGSLSSPQPPPTAVSTAIVTTVDDFSGGGEFAEDDDAVVEEEEDDDDFTLRSYRQPRGFSNRNSQPRDAVRVRVGGNNLNRSSNYGDFDDSPIPVPNPNPNPNPNYGFKGNYAHKSGYTNNYGSPPQYNGSRLEKNHHHHHLHNHNSSGSAGPSGLGMGMNYMNVNSSSNSKKRKMMNNGVDKRERVKGKGDEAALEMVDAIRMLGEGFVRMEKMKMEMMRETERHRIEMEMKRTEMLLESQHRIVEAFAKGWTDKKNDPSAS